MKTKYYVLTSAGDNGYHTVFKEFCQNIPNEDELRPLGIYNSNQMAIISAYQYYRNSKICSCCEQDVSITG